VIIVLSRKHLGYAFSNDEEVVATMASIAPIAALHQVWNEVVCLLRTVCVCTGKMHMNSFVDPRFPNHKIIQKKALLHK